MNGRRVAPLVACLVGSTGWLLAGEQVASAQTVVGEVDARLHSVSYERYPIAGGDAVRLERFTPFVTTLDITAWGFGLPGLSARVRSSYSEDLGAAAASWPATLPSLRLVEGYLEYARPELAVQAGRTSLVTRLGYDAFDGGRVDLRPAGLPVRATVFAGWSLARGSTLPVTSDGQNPLGEFRPSERGIVVGGRVDAQAGIGRVSATYRREVDPAASKLTSEFVAVSTALRLAEAVSLSGGVDYDVAAREWSTADVRLAWAGDLAGRRAGVAAFGRRYEPRFPLWSIWRAFSPVAYESYGGDVTIAPTAGLELRGSGEWFSFDDTGAASPLVTVEDGGWRWSAGAGWTGVPDWRFDGSFGADFGPGASTTHARVAAAWRPVPAVTASAWAARGTRPLEFRIDDAIVRSIGFDAGLQVAPRIRLDGGASWHDEERSGRFGRGFDHWRVRAGVRYGFGGASASTRAGLHPAIMRIPERPPVEDPS